MTDFISLVIFPVLLLIVHLCILAFAIHLLRNNNKLGYLVGILLIVFMPLSIKALPIPVSGDPVNPPVCTNCQEAIAENYSYCPYCGESQGN